MISCFIKLSIGELLIYNRFIFRTPINGLIESTITNVEGNAKTNRTKEEETQLRDRNIRFTVAMEKPVVLKETEDKIKFLKQFGDIYSPRIELCWDSFLIEKLDQTKAKKIIKYLKNLTKEHAQEHLDEFVQVMNDVIDSKSNYFSSRFNVYTDKCQHFDSSGTRVEHRHLKDFSFQISSLLNESFTEDIQLELWKHFKKKSMQEHHH